MVLGRRQMIRIGRKAVIDSAAPTGCAAVFEDDGDTGYFYAVRMDEGEPHILDALHIYDADAVTDGDLDHELEIIWDDGGRDAVLRLNGFVHAMIGFDPPLAMCVGEYPPPSSGFVDSHAWDEQAFQRVFGELESEWEWRRQNEEPTNAAS